MLPFAVTLSDAELVDATVALWPAAVAAASTAAANAGLEASIVTSMIHKSGSGKIAKKVIFLWGF